MASGIPHQTERRPGAWETGAFLLVAVAAAGYFLLFYRLNYLKWTYFDPLSPDIGTMVYLRDAWRAASFKANVVLSPGVYLLALGMFFLPFPEYALAISPLFTALSIIVLYRVGRRLTGRVWPALALAFSYLANPFVEIYSFLGMKPEAPGIFFLFLFLYLLLRGRRRAAAAAAVGAMLFKIEFVPVVLLLALWGYYRQSHQAARPALIAALAMGLAYGAAIAALYFDSTLGGFSRSVHSPFDWLWERSLGEGLGSLFSRPNAALALLMFPTAFICLLAPYWTFVPGIFHILITILLAGGWMQGGFQDPFLVYPASIWTAAPRAPIVWVALIYLGAAQGLARLPARGRTAVIAALFVCGGAYHWLAGTPLAGPLPVTSAWSVYSYRYGPTPGSRHLRATLNEIESSGQSACLTWQYPFYFTAVVAGRPEPVVDGVPCDVAMKRPQWILIDLLVDTFPDKGDILDWTLAVLADPHYRVHSWREGVLLLERCEAGSENQAAGKAELIRFIRGNRAVLEVFLPHRELYRQLLEREGGSLPEEIAPDS